MGGWEPHPKGIFVISMLNLLLHNEIGWLDNFYFIGKKNRKKKNKTFLEFCNLNNAKLRYHSLVVVLVIMVSMTTMFVVFW